MSALLSLTLHYSSRELKRIVIIITFNSATHADMMTQSDRRRCIWIISDSSHLHIARLAQWLDCRVGCVECQILVVFQR